MNKVENKKHKEENKASGTNNAKEQSAAMEKEIGGYEDQGLPEPTRYNDWEVKGRCSDF